MPRKKLPVPAVILPVTLSVPVMAACAAVITSPAGDAELLNSCAEPTHTLLPVLTARLPRLVIAKP